MSILYQLGLFFIHMQQGLEALNLRNSSSVTPSSCTDSLKDPFVFELSLVWRSVKLWKLLIQKSRLDPSTWVLLWKLAADFTAEPIAHIFNQSLQTTSIPQNLESSLRSLSEGWDPLDFNNYPLYPYFLPRQVFRISSILSAETILRWQCSQPSDLKDLTLSPPSKHHSLMIVSPWKSSKHWLKTV